jgi:hypothetical protein
MEAVVAEVLAVQAQVTIRDSPTVVRIAIDHAIPPVRLSVPKLARALLEPVVLLVIARRFVMHITLQQAAQLIIIILTSQALPRSKEILRHIATAQDIHLAIVWVMLMDKSILEAVVLLVIARTIVQGGMLQQEIRHIATNQEGLVVTLWVTTLARALLELAVHLVIARHFVTDTNTQAVAMAQDMCRELQIQHIAINQDFPLAMT